MLPAVEDVPAPREQKLEYESEDTISSLKYSPNHANHLLISSWDGSLTLMDTVENRILMRTSTLGEPLLDNCFGTFNSFAFTGGLNGRLRIHDLGTGQFYVVGKHNSAVKSVAFSRESRVALSGSWDSTVIAWDSRSPGPVSKMSQPERVYTMSTVGDVGVQLLVGTAGRKLLLWDLRSTDTPLQQRESSLKHQTRVVACFPDETGFALGSIEGRIGYEYFDCSVEAQRKKYAFKCHRTKDVSDVELVFPVNTISFHPRRSVFASGGSDGFVSIWDGVKKKRLCQLHRFRQPITSVDFSKDGRQLAVASSQVIPSNPEAVCSGQVHVRQLSEREIGF